MITSSEPWNTETNQTDQNPPITNNKPRSFELVQVNLFPKKSAKMIDGTGKPKIPLKFATYTAQYNKFDSNYQPF